MNINISPDSFSGHIDHTCKCEKNMERYNLQHVSRFEIPITLKPDMATFEDIAIHLIYRQRLTKRYTERLLNYAGKMATHLVPVDFQKPDFVNFIQHMDYREQIENATQSILKLEWTIMQHFLTAYGIPYGSGTIWRYKPPSIPPPKPRYIPLPDR